jgi:hypothetical protein
LDEGVSIDFVVEPEDLIADLDNRLAGFLVPRRIAMNFVIAPAIAFALVTLALSLVSGRWIWREQGAAWGVLGLLIGISFLCIGGFLAVRVFYWRWKFIRAAHELPTSNQLNIAASARGFSVSSKERELEVSWIEVKRVDATRNALRLVGFDEEPVLVPRRAFVSDEEFDSFYQKILRLWDEGSKTAESEEDDSDLIIFEYRLSANEVASFIADGLTGTRLYAWIQPRFNLVFFVVVFGFILAAMTVVKDRLWWSDPAIRLMTAIAVATFLLLWFVLGRLICRLVLQYRVGNGYRSDFLHPTKIQISRSGLHVVDQESKAMYQWTRVTKMKRVRAGTIISMPDGSAVAVPVRVFEDSDAYDRFLARVRELKKSRKS